MEREAEGLRAWHSTSDQAHLAWTGKLRKGSLISMWMGDHEEIMPSHFHNAAKETLWMCPCDY